MGFFLRDERVDFLMEQVASLMSRINVLESNARYVADQPISQYYSLFSHCNPDANVVPINDVVKAIVKHLDMQIENVPAQTTNTPQEVKVVKKPDTIILNTNGVTGTTRVNIEPIPTPPQPKPKRKYTKRETK